MKRLNKANLTTEKHAAELLLKAKREEFYELKGAIDNYEELFRKYWNAYMGEKAERETFYANKENENRQFVSQLPRYEKWIGEALSKINSIYNEHRDLINGLMFPELTADKNESENESKVEEVNESKEEPKYVIDFETYYAPKCDDVDKAVAMAKRIVEDNELNWMDKREVEYAKDAMIDAVDEYRYKFEVREALWGLEKTSDALDRAEVELEAAEDSIENTYADLVSSIKKAIEKVAA